MSDNETVKITMGGDGMSNKEFDVPRSEFVQDDESGDTENADPKIPRYDIPKYVATEQPREVSDELLIELEAEIVRCTSLVRQRQSMGEVAFAADLKQCIKRARAAITTKEINGSLFDLKAHT